MMKEKIQYQLKALEKQYNIHILYACEAGSRAWGFSSPDSDYDVRFIYKHELSFYLSLEKQKDTIDPAMGMDGIPHDFDMGGWDIQKAMTLLMKSNMPLLEWIHAPVLYIRNTYFIERLKETSLSCFSPMAGFHHYHSMAKKYTALCEGESYKLKHLFYALRTALAAHWIINKQSFPPVDFALLLSGLEIPEEVRNEISRLKALKAKRKESYLHPSSKRLVGFLQNILAENEAAVASLQPSKGNVKVLNKLYQEMVMS